MMGTGTIRTRWAAVGAAITVALGGGGLGFAFATASSGERAIYIPITPCRLADTRPSPDTVGLRSTPLHAGEIATMTGWGAVGNCNLSSGTAGLALNVTAVGATGDTYLTLWPSDRAQPKASNLNPAPGQPPTPNAVNVDLSADGRFNIYNNSGDVNVIVDVVGIYDDHNHDDRYYTKSELDARLAALQNYYTKSEVDARLAPLHNSVAAFAGGQQSVDIGAIPTIVRSISLMPPANGTVIVSSSAHMTRNSPSASGARCSITTGSAIDYSFLQITDLTDEFFATTAGTRGFAVTNGVLLTVNLVCDEYAADMTLQDSSLTAIFAPT